MLLLVGLGNPGAKYSGNRHNIGFMAVDAISREHRFPPFRQRFQGQTAEGSISGERVILLKPETFMNDSGRSVAEAARFHKIPLENTAVIHDELDLAPGKFRIKIGGGDAGHNGLRSITAHLGKDYKRLRLGIGHPGDKSLVHAFVLNDFGKGERAWVSTLCDAMARNADLIVKPDDSLLQTKVYLAMQAAGFGDEKPPGPQSPSG